MSTSVCKVALLKSATATFALCKTFREYLMKLVRRLKVGLRSLFRRQQPLQHVSAYSMPLLRLRSLFYYPDVYWRYFQLMV